MAVPTKISSLVASLSHFMLAKPRTKGTTTPATAASSALRPTWIRSCGLVSSPALKRTKMAPISATGWMVSRGSISSGRRGQKQCPPESRPGRSRYSQENPGCPALVSPFCERQGGVSAPEISSVDFLNQVWLGNLAELRSAGGRRSPTWFVMTPARAGRSRPHLIT